MGATRYTESPGRLLRRPQISVLPHLRHQARFSHRWRVRTFKEAVLGDLLLAKAASELGKNLRIGLLLLAVKNLHPARA